jgi:16S rRNA U516 pseudouridylate synthase RsuA-like enzyme
MIAALGHEVAQLVRVRVGKLELGDLRPGELRAIPPGAVD